MQEFGGILRLFTAAKNRNTVTLVSGRWQNTLGLWVEGQFLVAVIK